MMLPLLFIKIIEHDKTKPKGEVIDLRSYKAWLLQRRLYTLSAETYVKNQRGG